MNKGKNPFNITKPILVFCMILLFIIMVSCNKSDNNANANNVNRKINESTFVEKSSNVNNKSKAQQPTKEVNFNLENNDKYIDDINREDLSNIKNTYYGKYSVDGKEVLGNFEVSRNSIVFTPDNGYDKEIIHFNGIRNIDRRDHPNGKIDLSLQFDGYEKVIKNVSDTMFSDILLYTTK